MRFSDMEHSRVGILGAGREGQAVWHQLRRRYPGKTISIFSESAIKDEFPRKIDPLVDALHIGPLDVASLEQFDILVRSAGISIYRDELKQLRSMGVQFTSASSLWFAENPGVKTVCVTGTSGKSTTASLIALLLNRAGVKACLAGNIGKPMLDCDDQDVDWFVIELSSYQISDLEAKPDVAVLLNISEDHLDWHEGYENYRTDKLRLASLTSDGQVIANFSDRELKKSLENHQRIGWFNRPGCWQPGETGVCKQPVVANGVLTESGQIHVKAPVSLPGEHNMQNLAAALTVVDTLGLTVPQLDDALSAFSGLPHRLQLIGEKNGIRYINDSISTTPFSVAAALQAIGHQDVVLLMGGKDRGLDWSGFAREILASLPYAMIGLPDNGQQIFECFEAAGSVPKGGLHLVPGLQEAVSMAEQLVPRRGCILLSPGAPSFPHFRDYEDRGEQFARFSGF